MTQQKFLLRFSDALAKNGAQEADRILAAYEAHFAVRETDGFRAEEIAAELGNPVALAARFAGNGKMAARHKKALAAVGLGLLDLLAIAVYALIWECVSLVGSLSLCALLFSPALIGAVYAPAAFGAAKIGDWLVQMPRSSGIAFALALAALAVFSADWCVLFGVFAAHLPKAYTRFHKNAMRITSGRAPFPRVPFIPQPPARTGRRMRGAALVSFSAFGVCALVGTFLLLLAEK